MSGKRITNPKPIKMSNPPSIEASNPYGLEWERRRQWEKEVKPHQKIGDINLQFDYNPGLAQQKVEVPERQRRGTGRVGVDKELWDVVGKSKTRDIVRNTNWISPLAFAKWGKRYPAEAAKFEGNWERHNPMDEESEFVVRRKISGVSPEKWPLVAINGYTTKASDYGIRSKYYEDEKHYDNETNKFIGGRLKPIGEFAREYFNKQYQLNNYLDPNTGYPTEKYYSTLKQIKNDYGGRLHISAPSPYNIFTKKIVTGAYNVIVNEFEKRCKVPADKTKYILNQLYGPGWLLERSSNAWKTYVKEPFLDNLKNYVSNLDAWQTKFQSTERKIKFGEWIMRQKPIKTVFKDYCRQILTTGSKMCLTILDKLMHYFKGLCADALQGYVDPNVVKKMVIQVKPPRARSPPVNEDEQPMEISDDED